MKRIYYILELLTFFLKEVLVSNLKVARDVLSPSMDVIPGIVSVQVGQLTDRQRFALANMITMTPGTLSLEFSSDKRTLFLHTLYLRSSNTLQEEITNQYERRIRLAL
ncbi:Na+/H+ antiporter subunit E [Pelagicoccus mobilis]|uniref:Na+/H+ antiporter subunit E n=1 Tax=Pelagicoccus mobilis TaxID=415221 RepID=A0A934VRA9_9BACT|nr:Na+/H+ antiporter subunit E [Pelagicoccus mobilis]MBK1879202.1 Na+/H+ antiporter subunit E [Pelagicoccus mobilis]